MEMLDCLLSNTEIEGNFIARKANYGSQALLSRKEKVCQNKRHENTKEEEGSDQIDKKHSSWLLSQTLV